MTTAGAPEHVPPIIRAAPGLVVMLDAAGRTIADLEDRVENLTRALAEERRKTAELSALLLELRATANVHT